MGFIIQFKCDNKDKAFTDILISNFNKKTILTIMDLVEKSCGYKQLFTPNPNPNPESIQLSNVHER